MFDPAVREGRYALHSWQTGATGPDQIHTVRTLFTVTIVTIELRVPAAVASALAKCYSLLCSTFLLSNSGNPAVVDIPR